MTYKMTLLDGRKVDISCSYCNNKRGGLKKHDFESGGNMTEYIKDLTSLVKNTKSTIVISDDQIDETGKIMREPVLVFSVGGEKMGYVPVLELEKWMRYHLYASSFLEKITTFEMVKKD
jgi:hypothetical protein